MFSKLQHMKANIMMIIRGRQAKKNPGYGEA
jgi:hypothetical protein